MMQTPLKINLEHPITSLFLDGKPWNVVLHSVTELNSKLDNLEYLCLSVRSMEMLQKGEKSA
jgi:hypothetical protein